MTARASRNTRRGSPLLLQRRLSQPDNVVPDYVEDPRRGEQSRSVQAASAGQERDMGDAGHKKPSGHALLESASEMFLPRR